MLWIHYYSIILIIILKLFFTWNNFPALKILYIQPMHPSPPFFQVYSYVSKILYLKYYVYNFSVIALQQHKQNKHETRSKTTSIIYFVEKWRNTVIILKLVIYEMKSKILLDFIFLSFILSTSTFGFAFVCGMVVYLNMGLLLEVEYSFGNGKVFLCFMCKNYMTFEVDLYTFDAVIFL